ncbi:MAG: WD40 repeat domain-containing protein [Planctomycetota bacterium]
MRKNSNTYDGCSGRPKPMLVCLVSMLLSAFTAPPLVAADPPIIALRFAPGGTTFVAGSTAGVRSNRWPDLGPINELTTRINAPHDIAFSPLGDKLAIAGGTPGEDGVVEVLEWPSGDSLAIIDEHFDTVMSVTWLDDSRVALASLDHGITVADASNGQVAFTLHGHSRGVTTLCFLPDDDLLVSSGVDQSLRVWNTKTGELIHSLNQHTRPVNALALRPNHPGLAVVASASDDRTVRFWQPKIGRMMRFVRLDSRPLSIGWLPDGSRLIAACVDGNIRVVDPETVQVVSVRPALEGWAYCVAVHSPTGEVVVGGDGGEVVRMTGLGME